MSHLTAVPESGFVRCFGHGSAWFLAVLVLVLCGAPVGALQVPLQAPDQSPDHAQVLVGEVTVRALADGRVAVVLNQFDAREPDETAEHVFLLQTNDPAPTELPIRMGAARVVSKRDRLLVLSLEEPVAVGLFLSEVDPTAVEAQLSSMLVEQYGRGEPETLLLQSGYGLARHRGRFDLPIESWPPRRPDGSEASLERKDVEEAGLCHSGGPGSTSCSITCVVGGCSTDCGPGYYSCCKCAWTPSCTCVSDGGDGSGNCPPLPCVE